LTCDTPRTRNDLTDQNGQQIGGRARGACSPSVSGVNADYEALSGRGLHSFTVQLNLSRV